MEIIIAHIIRTFTPEFCIAFTATDANTTEHEEFGLNPLTLEQFENSKGLMYKQMLYRNIQKALQTEVDSILSGEAYQECLDKPLVNSPLVGLLWNNNMEGAHELNKRLKYPELMEHVDNVVEMLSKKLSSEMAAAYNIKSDRMPYKSQFVLEEVIAMTQKKWSKSV
jgi:hypothetical protein